MVDAIDDDTRRRIADLHAEGASRNGIARDLGISSSTVSKYALELGLTWDRAAPKAAAEARKADVLDRRSRLELAYLEDAERLRLEVWASREYATVTSGESGPRVVRYDMDTPTPADQHKLMQASTLAAAASQKITDAAVDQSAAAARSMLVNIMSGLENVFRAVQAEDLTQPGDNTP